MKQIKDLNSTQVAQSGKIIEELFLDWDEYPSLSEDRLLALHIWKAQQAESVIVGLGNRVHLPLIPNQNINS